jgi:SAM-dependent methyltransferase
VANTVSMLESFHHMLESAQGYRLSQLFGLPTIRRYRTLVHDHIPQSPDRRVLEIGCGVGSAREWFTGDHTGVDINPDYIRRARERFAGNFQVMDAAQMSFGPNTFDDAVSIATTHHLTDAELGLMIRTATDVASSLHIIDAILPMSPKERFKSALFRMDRGRYARTFEQLRDVVMQNARFEIHELLWGPLHDVCYIRASRERPQ